MRVVSTCVTPLGGLAPPFFMLTPCSLSMSGRWRITYVAPVDHAHWTDYGAFAFFDYDLTKVPLPGPHAVSVTRRVGRGQIMCIGDSTFLSTFCLYLPGTPGFLMLSLKWLTGGLRALAILQGLIALAGFALVGAKVLSKPVWCLLLGTIASGAGAFLLISVHKSIQVAPDVCFQSSLGEMDIRSLQREEDIDNLNADHGTCYMLTVCSGMVPAICSAKPYRSARVAVIINPSGYPSDALFSELISWVSQGRAMLILIDHQQVAPNLIKYWRDRLANLSSSQWKAADDLPLSYEAYRLKVKPGGEILMITGNAPYSTKWLGLPAESPTEKQVRLRVEWVRLLKSISRSR